MGGSQEVRIFSERPPGRKQFGPLRKALHTMEKLQRLTTMGGKVFDASVLFQVAWIY